MNRRLARLLIAALAITGLTGLIAVPAAADPVNAKKGEILPIECDHLGPLTVSLNGNGASTPGHVVGSTRVGKPYRIDITTTFTPVGGEPETESEVLDKPAPRSGRLDVCTISLSDTNEFGTFTAEGTVWISYTPAR